MAAATTSESGSVAARGDGSEAGDPKSGDAAASTAAGSMEAAILLMALGEEEAAGVLRYMEPAEVQAIGAAMSNMGGVSQQAIGDTLDRFASRIVDDSSLGFDSKDYFRSTLARAIGPERATNVLSRLEPTIEQRRPASLKWMHPRSITRLLRDEHPQVIATVLGILPREQAGEVLMCLPAEQQCDLLQRITRLDTVHPAALAEIDAILNAGLVEDAEVELAGLGGLQSAAEILNAIDKSVEQRLLEEIDALDEELGTKIREGMFVFENLLEVDNRSLQTLLRELNNDSLILALKGASKEVAEKLFSNMSKRAAELLADDLSAKGPVRLSEVETAQREILDTAKRLEADGSIQLGGSGEALV